MKNIKKLIKITTLIVIITIAKISYINSSTVKFNKLKEFKKNYKFKTSKSFNQNNYKYIINSSNNNLKRVYRKGFFSKDFCCGYNFNKKETVLVDKKYLFNPYQPECTYEYIPKTSKANSFLAIDKFSKLIKRAYKSSKKVINLAKIKTIKLYNGLKYVVAKVFNFTYYMMNYMWTFLLRNVRSIENSLFYINSWLNKPADMIILTMIKGIKSLGNLTAKGLLYLKNKIFKEFNNKELSVVSNVVEVVQEKSDCTSDKVDLINDKNKLISLDKNTINKIFYNDRYVYLMTSGFIYGIFYSLIPQKISGNQNKEKKSDESGKKEEYRDVDTGEKVDPNEWLAQEDKNIDNQDFNSAAWDNKSVDNNPFSEDTEIPNIPDNDISDAFGNNDNNMSDAFGNNNNNMSDAFGNNDNLIDFSTDLDVQPDEINLDINTDDDNIGFDNDLGFDMDLKKKRYKPNKIIEKVINNKNNKTINNNKSYKKLFRKVDNIILNTLDNNFNFNYETRPDNHGSCPVTHSGIVIDKIARNASRICALNYMKEFSPIIKTIVEWISGNYFKENTDNLKNIISDLNSNLKEDIKFKDSNIDNNNYYNNPKEDVKQAKSAAKKIFSKFGSLFVVGIKKMGKILKVIGKCTLKFGESIVENLKSYSAYLISNTSMLPLNSFLQSLPVVKEISGIFKIVLLIFMIWRILSFRSLLKLKIMNFKQKEEECKILRNKDKNNKCEGLTNAIKELESEFYVYGKHLSRLIIFSMQAIFFFTGIAGIMNTISVAYFIGSIIVGIAAKLIKKTKQIYNKIKNNMSKNKVNNGNNNNSKINDKNSTDKSNNKKSIASKGYKQLIVMQSKSPEERRKLVQALKNSMIKKLKNNNMSNLNNFNNGNYNNNNNNNDSTGCTSNLLANNYIFNCKINYDNNLNENNFFGLTDEFDTKKYVKNKAIYNKNFGNNNNYIDNSKYTYVVPQSNDNFFEVLPNKSNNNYNSNIIQHKKTNYTTMQSSNNNNYIDNSKYTYVVPQSNDNFFEVLPNKSNNNYNSNIFQHKKTNYTTMQSSTNQSNHLNKLLNPNKIINLDTICNNKYSLSNTLNKCDKSDNYFTNYYHLDCLKFDKNRHCDLRFNNDLTLNGKCYLKYEKKLKCKIYKNPLSITELKKINIANINNSNNNNNNDYFELAYNKDDEKKLNKINNIPFIRKIFLKVLMSKKEIVVNEF